MIEIIKEILVSVTVVSIFSGVVINLSCDKNREIVKLGCSMLMVIALISAFKEDINFDDFNLSKALEDYKEIASSATQDTKLLEKNMIKSDLENFVRQEINITCEVIIDDAYNIEKVLIYEDYDVKKIAELLGINQEKIEYIKSRWQIEKSIRGT